MLSANRTIPSATKEAVESASSSFNWRKLFITFGLLLAFCSLGAAFFLPSTERIIKTVKIQDLKLGRRAVGTNPDRTEVDETIPDVDQETWRELHLTMQKEDGYRIDIELLRPLEWIEFYSAVVGSTVELELHEMGAVGPALVTYFGPCPPIEPDDGTGRNVVTGRFKHYVTDNLVNVSLEGQDEPTGVTDNHLYWSVTRNKFVPAGELEIGEEVDTIHGTTKVTSIVPRAGPEPVYNLEIHREHVYRVGELGTLVHNTCVPSPRARGWDRATRKRLNKQLADAGVPSSQRHEILNDIRDNFTDYHKVQVSVAKRDRVLHRWHDNGKNAREIARYGTKSSVTRSFARNQNAVKADWNMLTNASRLRIKKGTVVIEGTTAAQYDEVLKRILPGGGQQIFVPSARTNVFK